MMTIQAYLEYLDGGLVGPRPSLLIIPRIIFTCATEKPVQNSKRNAVYKPACVKSTLYIICIIIIILNRNVKEYIIKQINEGNRQ